MGLLSPTDIATVSALLDEALELPAAEREAWLAALPAEHQRHAEALRAMLAERDSTRGGAFLASGPQLAGGVADDAVAKPGELVGAYRLLREIGRGGMGSVWLAERADGAFERQVALKLPRLTWDEGLAERMARERRIGALLEHPNIARLYDAGLDEHGRPFLALEYIEGQPIDDWCREQRLDVKARLRLLVQVVRAVAYAHGRLVVHRDLKPSNVLVTADGQAHLLDFGIAKLLQADNGPGLTQEQGRVMTPHYASPEQIAGDAVTVQSDVYSLGVLLYELLTGVLPYEGRRHTMGALEEAILQGDVPLASSRAHDKALARQLRGELDAIVGKAMQRQLARRYATADALADDIERYLKGDTVTARPDSVAYRWAKFVRRNWLGAGACAAVLVAIVTGSSIALMQARRANAEAERARLVSAFVTDIFKLNTRTDPANAELRRLPVEQLLDRAASVIDARFSGQFDTQAQLYRVVVDSYFEMGDLDLARTYAETLVKTTQLSGGSVEDRVLAQLQLARAQPRIEERAAKAREALALTDGSPMLEAHVRLRVGVYLESGGRSADAERELEIAERLIDSAGKTPSLERARAQQLRAQLLSNRNQFPQALPLFERAIATAEAVQGPGSPLAMAIRAALVPRLVETLRTDAAQRHLQSFLAARRALGGPYDVYAARIEALSVSLLFDETGNMGRRQIPFDFARRTLERLRAEAEHPDSRMPRVTQEYIRFRHGWVLASWGRVEEGYRLIGPAYEALSRFQGSPTRAQMSRSSIAGLYAMQAGDHRLADELLRRNIELGGRVLAPGSPFMAFRYTFLARNLSMQGRFDEASEVLASAPEIEVDRGNAETPTAYRDSMTLHRVMILLDRGAYSEALSLLEARPLTAYDPFTAPTLLRGWGRCANGEPRAGLVDLEAGLEAIGPETFYEHTPELARIRALAGRCSLKSGDRAKALAFQQSARAAFTAQPGVSPYYKAPLIELERALGLKLPPP